MLQPLGEQLITGGGSFALAVSPSGRAMASANLGPERPSITLFESDRKGVWSARNVITMRPENSASDFHGVSAGIVFSGEKQVWVSEGDSGRARLIDVATGSRRRQVDLNTGDFSASYAGALALDSARDLLYVVDEANFRVCIFDAKRAVMLKSIAVGNSPYAIGLSPDGTRAYVTNVGLFRYDRLPSFDPAHSKKIALVFPQPAGANTLGDPNGRESSSISVIDTSRPESAKVISFIRTGLQVGSESAGGSAPSAVIATADAVYVSNAHNDTIDVIDPKRNQITATIPLFIPGLERLRGVVPLGMALDENQHRLFVAAAGLNAVGVVDTEKRRLLALLPVGWFPTSVAFRNGFVAVANAKGHGAGPSAVAWAPDFEEFGDTLGRGSLTRFSVPPESEFPKQSRLVLAANGLLPVSDTPAPKFPVRHVVVILKEGRTFDEILGDTHVGDDNINGVPRLARFGKSGYARGDRNRFSLQEIDVTPNQHALASQFAFSDNFYADGESAAEGHHWISGTYPCGWTESLLITAAAGNRTFGVDPSSPGRLVFGGGSAPLPEGLPQAGSLWHHLERNAVPFLSFGEGLDVPGSVVDHPGAIPTTNVPISAPLYRNTARDYPSFNLEVSDQVRATRFIEDIEANYLKPHRDLPQFVFIRLPNDHAARPQPQLGYPYEASYIADNDVALGRIVEYLSHTPWWREMVVLVTEADAHGGRDHVDAHRTVLLGIGPYVRRGYVSHVNADFPSLLKTTFRLLNLPPLNLFDASASDLSDMFTDKPDFTPYNAEETDVRLFDAHSAKTLESAIAPLVERAQ